MSAARVDSSGNDLLLTTSLPCRRELEDCTPLRVTISCPEKGNSNGKLVRLPGSIEELLEIGANKFGFLPARVLTQDGAEIDELEPIRDCDHLILVSNEWNGALDCTPKDIDTINH